MQFTPLLQAVPFAPTVVGSRKLKPSITRQRLEVVFDTCEIVNSTVGLYVIHPQGVSVSPFNFEMGDTIHTASPELDKLIG